MNGIIDQELREEVEEELGKEFKWTEVDQGVNDVFILGSEDRDLVLKVQSDIEVDRASEAEVELYRTINAETDVPSPEVVYKDFSRDKVDFSFYLMEKMPGEKAEEVWPEMSMETREKILCQYGEILGKIHDIKSFTGYGPIELENEGLSVEKAIDSWNEFLIHRFKQWKGSLQESKFPEIAIPEESDLEKLVSENPEPVLIHEDNRLDNLILKDSGIAGFLDWSSPISGSGLYDLARAEYLLIDGDTTYAGQEILSEDEKTVLREKLIDGYRNSNSLPSNWADSEERKIYRYAAVLNIAADFKEWIKHMNAGRREEIRKELVHRIKAEQPKKLMN